MRSKWLCILLMVWTAAFAGAADKTLLPEYRLQNTYVLGGEGAWWDYVTFDAAGLRLFIARDTHVLVVDTGSGKLTAEIPDTPGVHGVALAPELGRGFISAGGNNTVTIFDLKTLKPLGKVPTADGPDAILYDPVSKRVFSFNGRGRSTTVIGAEDGKVIATIALDGRPEFAVSDGKGRVYVEIEDKSELVVLDSQKVLVLSRWPLAPCEEPAALAIDAAHRRLFVGCRNHKLAVVNADTGKVIATFPIGQGVDAAAFDPATQLAFAANWDGTVTVIHEDAPDLYTLVSNVPTAIGARTMALDPRTHNLYLVTAKFQDAERDRRATVPGSFQLLVVGPATSPQAGR